VKKETPGNKSVSLSIEVLEESESPFEIMQARHVLEEGIIKEAVIRAAEEDISRLEHVLEKMMSAVADSDPSSYFQANREFHLAIASATHNSVLVILLRSLLKYEEKKLWKESIQRYLSEPDHIKRYVTRHERLLATIKERNIEMAAKEMKRHFSETAEGVREYL
jgi:GntR family uxuAB operon transcriptional repressor